MVLVKVFDLQLNGTPGRNRTYGQKLRSLLLYPLSYRGMLNIVTDMTMSGEYRQMSI